MTLKWTKDQPDDEKAHIGRPPGDDDPVMWAIVIGFDDGSCLVNGKSHHEMPRNLGEFAGPIEPDS